MSKYAPNAISVPESFARAIVAWQGRSFDEVMDEVESLMTGRLMNRRTGATLSDVKRESKLIPFGFVLATTSPALIAWMQGSPRKAYTVVPRSKKVLSWIGKDGQRVFARSANIPAWRFTPVRPVFEDAIKAKRNFMVKQMELVMLGALNTVFPDVTIQWKVTR